MPTYLSVSIFLHHMQLCGATYTYVVGIQVAQHFSPVSVSRIDQLHDPVNEASHGSKWSSILYSDSMLYILVQ